MVHASRPLLEHNVALNGKYKDDAENGAKCLPQEHEEEKTENCLHSAARLTAAGPQPDETNEERKDETLCEQRDIGARVA